MPSNSERCKAWRDKQKGSDEGIIRLKEYETLKWNKRKATGKVKLIKDLTLDEQANQRRKWAEI